MAGGVRVEGHTLPDQLEQGGGVVEGRHVEPCGASFGATDQGPDHLGGGSLAAALVPAHVEAVFDREGASAVLRLNGPADGSAEHLDGGFTVTEGLRQEVHPPGALRGGVVPVGVEDRDVVLPLVARVELAGPGVEGAVDKTEPPRWVPVALLAQLLNKLAGDCAEAGVLPSHGVAPVEEGSGEALLGLAVEDLPMGAAPVECAQVGVDGERLLEYTPGQQRLLSGGAAAGRLRLPDPLQLEFAFFVPRLLDAFAGS